MSHCSPELGGYGRSPRRPWANTVGGRCTSGDALLAPPFSGAPMYDVGAPGLCAGGVLGRVIAEPLVAILARTASLLSADSTSKQRLVTRGQTSGGVR